MLTEPSHHGCPAHVLEERVACRSSETYISPSGGCSRHVQDEWKHLNAL